MTPSARPPASHAHRRDRMARWIPMLPLVVPVLLAPLLGGAVWRMLAPVSFVDHRQMLLVAFLAYIVVVRFALLDLILFYIARRRRSLHFDLMHIVFLYLEVSAVTLLYFALLFYLFGVFTLFQYNGTLLPEQTSALLDHPLSVALYISVELFTTLGLGDWVPRTLNAMWAGGIEALLGFVQSGVFFAVIIYGHQTLKDES